MADPLLANLHGPGLVGPNGVLSPPLVNLIKELIARIGEGADAADVSAMQTQIDELAAALANTTYTGTNGVQVYGSTITLTPEAFIPVMARISLGF
jgi:hypothetical protein